MATPPPKARDRINRALDVTGRTLIAAGLLLLSFVAYQLWGTSISESRAQSAMATSFRAQSPGVPEYGGTVGKMTIPSIGVDKWIIAGIDTDSLKRGPGLFPGSPLPGQYGNVAIAGHRTTYGAPFGAIDRMKTGDEIRIATKTVVYTYIVDGPPRIVGKYDVSVIKSTDKTKAHLTLVSCHPKWTSYKRIIVTATLASTATPQKPTYFTPEGARPDTLAEGWFHDSSAWPVVIAFAWLLVAIVVVARALVRRSVRRSFVYPPAGAVFIVTLFFFFENLTRLLPTNL